MSDLVRVTSGLPKGAVRDPLMFHHQPKYYSNIRHFADDCVGTIHRYKFKIKLFRTSTRSSEIS